MSTFAVSHKAAVSGSVAGEDASIERGHAQAEPTLPTPMSPRLAVATIGALSLALWAGLLLSIT